VRIVSYLDALIPRKCSCKPHLLQKLLMTDLLTFLEANKTNLA